MQPDDDPGVILDIGLVAHSPDGLLFIDDLAAVSQDFGDNGIDIINIDRTDGALEGSAGPISPPSMPGVLASPVVTSQYSNGPFHFLICQPNTSR